MLKIAALPKGLKRTERGHVGLPKSILCPVLVGPSTVLAPFLHYPAVQPWFFPA